MACEPGSYGELGDFIARLHSMGAQQVRVGEVAVTFTSPPVPGARKPLTDRDIQEYSA